MARAPAGDWCSILRRRTWTPEEDRKLVAYIQRYRIWNWNHMAKFAGLSRSGKSCRLRWMNYLRPNIRHGNFSQEEDELIVKLQQQLGNRWSVIASKLPGRTDNEIKNCWNTRLRNKMKPELSSPKLEIKTVKSSELEGITLMSSPQHSNISYSSSRSSVDCEEIEMSIGAEDKMDTLEWFTELGSLWEEPLKIAAQGLCSNLEATQTQEHLNTVLLDRIWEQ